MKSEKKSSFPLLRTLVSALAAFLLPLGGEARAAEWSFQQLIDAATLNYPSVLSRQAAREAAEADLKNAQWQRYPTPSLESNLDHQGNSSFVLRLQQVLWAGGSITNNIAAARSLRQASDQAVREARFEVASRVIDGFVEAVRQQERRVIEQKNLEQHKLLDETIARRVASEVSPEVDHKLSQSRLSVAVNDLSTTKQALERSLNALSQLIDKEVGGAVPLELAPLELPRTREEALRQAVAISPALSRLSLEEAAAESQVKVKRAVLWPTLAVRYEKGFNNNAFLFGSAGDNRIMAVIEAQPGAGLSAISGIEAAQARTNSARQDRQAALRDLQRLVTDAWNDRESARSLLEFAQSAKVSASEVAESYKRQYIIGRKAWLDVLNAVREATQSELSVADARAQLSAATLRIALLTDKLKLEENTYALIPVARN